MSAAGRSRSMAGGVMVVRRGPDPCGPAGTRTGTGGVKGGNGRGYGAGHPAGGLGTNGGRSPGEQMGVVMSKQRTGYVLGAVSETKGTGPASPAAPAGLAGRARHWAASVLAGGALLLGLTPPAAAEVGTRVSAWTYDPASGLMNSEIVEPDETQMRLDTVYTYDAFGNTTAVTVSSPATGDAAIESRATTTTFDAATGRFPETVQNAVGHTETRVHDGKFGVLTSQTGPNDLTTTWQYDGFGRKTLEVRPDGTKTKWEYKYCDGVAGGTLLGCPELAKFAITTTPLAADDTQIGPKSVKFMDALGREVRAQTEGLDELGAETTAIHVDTEYDEFGRVGKKSRAYFTGTPVENIQWTEFSYDQIGRVITELMPDESRVEVIYDALATTVINGEVQFQTKYKNGQGQVIKVTDDDAADTHFAYDPFGNLSLVTDAMGNQTVFQYDQRGRKILMSDPDKGTWTYSYDALGQLKTQTDAEQQVTEITYDKLGRVTSKIARKSDLSIDQESIWQFDTGMKGIGKLAEAQSFDGAGLSISRRVQSYDSLGRPFETTITTETEAAQIFTSTYDQHGRPGTLTYPSGVQLEYAYTVRSELRSVSRIDTASPELVWQAEGREASRQLTASLYGNDVTSQFTYDAARGWLTAIQSQNAAATTIQDLTFTWNVLGNLMERADLEAGGFVETFTHDYMNRLTSAHVAGRAAVTLTYDLGGNIETKSDVGNYSYNASGPSSVRPHAVTGVSGGPAGTKSYAYDANGNMISGDGRSLVWAAFGKPFSVSSVGNPHHFAYDADYNRVVLEKDLTDKFYYNDPASGARAELTVQSVGNARTWIDHVIVEGKMVASVTTDISTSTQFMRYFHHDHLGSVQSVTDANGNRVGSRLSYDAWGKRRNADGSPGTITPPADTDRGYTGHEHLDDLALVHMNGRIYDPMLGRFLSADPFVQDPYNTQSFNRYAYVLNNPLALTDPSGYFSLGRIFKSLFRGLLFLKPIKRIVAKSRFLQTVIRIAAAAAGPQWAALASAYLANVNGGDLGDMIKAAALTYVKAMLFDAVGTATKGHFFENEGMFGGEIPEFTPEDYVQSGYYVANVAGHAVVGCATSAAEGGKCRSGALSAGFGAIVGPYTVPAEGARGLASAVVAGGIGAKLGGGKFENGAVTAAFGHLYNAMKQKPRGLCLPSQPACELLNGGGGGGGAAVPRSFFKGNRALELMRNMAVEHIKKLDPGRIIQRGLGNPDYRGQYWVKKSYTYQMKPRDGMKLGDRVEMHYDYHPRTGTIANIKPKRYWSQGTHWEP